MKKVLLSLALIFSMGLFLVSGYSETPNPKKHQTELFVQSCNLP